MIVALPSSTLFPYTTLFRSRTAVPAPTLAEVSFLGGKTTETVTTGRDRKSTRLNSSHVEISYAVFCLKKKCARKSNLINIFFNFFGSHPYTSIRNSKGFGFLIDRYFDCRISNFTANLSY